MNRTVEKWLGLCVVFSSLLSVHCYAQSDFDRLFTNKKSRNILDRQREAYVEITPTVQAGPATASTPFVSPEYQLNGIIIRSDGSTDVWLNNEKTLDKTTLGNSRRDRKLRMQNNMIDLTLPEGEKVTMKPGQIYSSSSGAIKEAYVDSQIDQQNKTMLDKIVDAVTSIVEDIAGAEETAESEDEQSPVEFDESQLGEQDFRIRLLEERLEKLEQGSGQ